MLSRTFVLFIASIAATAASSAAIVTERNLTSPDGTLAFTLERDDSTNQLYWSLTRSATPIITRGSLGITLSGTGDVADEGTISQAVSREVNETWTPPYGERATVPDHFREDTLTLASPDQGALTVQLQVRAYDEGLAFRYRINGTGTLTMSGEKTSYPLPSGASVWVATASQNPISKVAITSMGNGMERPLTAELSPDLFIALGEAGSFDFSRMKFSRTGTSTIVPALGGNSSFTDSLTTPWRFVRVATGAPGLLESNYLMWNLSEPSRVADTSWIKPGKMIREATLTTAGAIACVDWAADHGLDFIHFDAGWYGPENNSSSDATTVTVDPARSPGPLDLQAAITYAKSKNIGVVLYVNKLALQSQLDELLPLYESWGVAGIKFGFVNTGSQTWTKWLHDAIEKCAQHHLMVDVHDDYRMMGTERSLPNFMTAEGVRGDEESPPNEMVVKTIFTRGLAGAADHTNCYFATRVDSMGSHASQLAKSVCIYSPWQYLYWYDSPAASPNVGGKVSVLQDVPELSFFERLPTVWDETRWLQGHPDTHAVVARRKGDRWFIGGLNGSTAREFNIPLDFLPAGQNFRMELYRDDNSVATVTKVKIGTSVINRDSSIQRTVGVRNGIAAILTPTTDPLTPPDIDPPPPPSTTGMIRFETDQGYPAAGQIAGTTADPNGAPFSGADGWSLAGAAGNTFTTSTSGEYVGGQAAGCANTGTFTSGRKGGIQHSGASTLSFDAPFVSGGTAVGFMKDTDGDGLFETGHPSGGTPGSGLSFGIGGTPARFQYRDAGFGTEHTSGLTGVTGHWYHYTITIGESTGGSRSITLALRDLTSAADFDFNTATPEIDNWAFSVTDAQFGTSPEESDGVFIRATSASRIDNILATAHAADLQWDGTNSGGSGDGESSYLSGTWSSSIVNWDQGNGLSRVAWNNTNVDNAIFGGSYSTGIKTVTIGSDITVNQIRIDTGSTGGNRYDIGSSATQNDSAITFGGTYSDDIPALTGGGFLNTNFNAKITGDLTSSGGLVLKHASNITTPGSSGRFGFTNTNNNFSGDIVVAGGNLAANSNNSVYGNAANKIVLKGGALFMSSGSALTTTVTRTIDVAAASGLSTNATASGLQTMDLTGTLTGPANLTRYSNTGGSATSEVRFSGDMSGYTGTYESTGSVATLTTIQTTAPSGGAWKLSGGTVKLNTTDDTHIADGAGQSDLLINGGTLDLNGRSETINGLSGPIGTVQNQASSSISVLTIGGGDATASFGGSLRNNSGSGGTLALLKTGSGTQTLTGASTYTGATTVEGGSLVLSGSLAGSPITVKSAATFSGTGSASGAATIEAGGTLAPGTAGAGTLTLGSATVAGAVEFKLDASTCGSLTVTGALSISPGGGININLLNTPTAAGYTLLTYGTLSGTLPIISGVPDGYKLDANTPGLIQLVAAGNFSAWADSWNSPALSDKTPAGDPDHDGISNLMEYVIGGDPQLSDTRFLPTYTLSGGNLVLYFKRSDASESDTILMGQWSTDLANWTNVAPVLMVENGTDPDDMSVTIPLSSSEDGRLYGRILVTQI